MGLREPSKNAMRQKIQVSVTPRLLSANSTSGEALKPAENKGGWVAERSKAPVLKTGRG